MRSSSAHLWEVAGVFLRLGATAFGGPAVHLALLENEVVHRRKWVTHEEFLDLFAATNVIPGPNSTEMAIHLGHRRAGWLGLVLGGTCFIVPAFLITLACAWFYVRYAALPQVQGILYGVKPVVLAVVVQALWRLTASMRSKPLMLAIAAGALVANLLGVHELLVLLAAGVLAPLLRRIHESSKRKAHEQSVTAIALPPLIPGLAGMGAAAGAKAFGLGPLFLFFVKIGAVLYGSGYVLLAFLRADLVERWGWLTESQLLDAIAVGQVTPGPVFTTATFIGYVLAGHAGAALATIGIFLPAFLFVAASAPLLPRLRRSAVAGAVLDGVSAASLALMGAVTLRLLSAAFVDATTIALGLISAIALIAYRPNPIWLILAGAAIGLLAG
jgi:chromate transporter